MIGRSIVLLSFGLLLSSCGEYEQLERKKVLVKRADSLFAKQRYGVSTEIDSLCDMYYDEYYQQALDSIKQKQIKEIRDLMDM